MLVVAVGIFFTYIQPTYQAVSATKAEIADVLVEREKVSAVNDKLNSLLVTANKFTAEQNLRMETYLPAVIDPVSVQRDLLFIADEAGITLTGLSTDKPVTLVVASEEGQTPGVYDRLQKQQFGVSFDVPYEDLKQFLGLLEINHYPLYIRELEISRTTKFSGANMVSVDLTIETYAAPLPVGTAVPTP